MKLLPFQALLPVLSYGQVALNGITDVNHNAGLQPDIIQGVSALPTTGAPLIRHVYQVDKNILGIKIDERAIISSNLKPYMPQDGDSLVMGGNTGLSEVLIRHAEPIGYFARLNNEWYCPFNMVSGYTTDLNWASDPGNYSMTSDTDPNYRSPIQPERLFRKTKPNGSIRIAMNNAFTARHELYLKRHKI